MAPLEAGRSGCTCGHKPMFCHKLNARRWCEPTLDPSLDRVRATLAEHYLAGIECDHEARRDRPSCSCSLVDLGWHSSVGEAVQAWIDHVTVVAAPLTALMTGIQEPPR